MYNNFRLFNSVLGQCQGEGVSTVFLALGFDDTARVIHLVNYMGLHIGGGYMISIEANQIHRNSAITQAYPHLYGTRRLRIA